jgi:tetratricopeptide (TPR) repeat protein
MEKYQKYGINPLLISIATGQDVANLSLRPTVSMLPGRYSKIVYKYMDVVNSEFPENIFRLTCGQCGKSGDYDLGTLVFPVGIEAGGAVEKFQALGYFRCKHCNSAGEWEMSSRMRTMLAGKMAAAAFDNPQNGHLSGQIIFGEALIDNVFSPRWGSDTENYFLKKLADNPQNAYFWNRLGNAYYRGKRPELAVFAHEQAVTNDVGQVESHFSLGKKLFSCGELEQAAAHLRQAVAFSHQYKYLTAYDLMEIIVGSLEILFTIYKQSDNKINMLPKPNEQTLAKNQIAATSMLDFEIDVDRRETLYPLAELYLGDRVNELRFEQRTASNYRSKVVWPMASKANKQKPPKKNKKKNKK